jgi:hypothetical protein
MAVLSARHSASLAPLDLLGLRADFVRSRLNGLCLLKIIATELD